MKKSIWLFALLAAVGAMPRAEAQQPAMQTVGIELRGDTVVYRTVHVPHRRHGALRGKAWADYSHTPWSPEQRLFALSKFWMEVRRNFAYMDRFGVERWDSLYRSMIVPVQQARNDVEFYRQLEVLCARLQNEQTFIRHSRDFPQSAVRFEDGWMLRLMDVGGHVVVSEVSRDKVELLPPGSEILAVDGRPVEARLGEGMTRVSASTDRVRRRMAVEQMLLDMVGTQHEVTFRRPDGTQACVRLVNARPQPGEQIACAALNLSRVTSALFNQRTGYIRISMFTGNCATEFSEAIKDLTDRGMRSLVIDLRNNPGGSLSDVVSIADTLLGEGTIVSVRGRAESEGEVYKSNAKGVKVPIAVIVNENSASASEILAAAVQDFQAGAVVGMTTYGKGVVQTTKQIEGNRAWLKLTSDAYYTPNGANIDGVGVTPDIEIDLPEELKGLAIDQIEQDDDAQLWAALDYVRTLADEAE